MTETSQLPSDPHGKNSGLNGAEDGDLSPLASVGLDLRNARLEQKLELEVVSRALKIRVNHLTALEEGRLEALPGRTYAVGFVRSYAGYLGLDARDFVRRFKEEIAGRHDMATPPAPSLDIEETRKMSLGWWILGLIVLALVIYGGYQLLMNVNKAAQPTAVQEPPGYGMSDPGEGAVSGAAPSPVAQASPAAPSAAPAAQPAQSTQPASQPVAPAAQSAQTAVTSPAATDAATTDASAVDPDHQPQELGMGNKSYSRVQLKIIKPAFVKVTGSDGRLFLSRNLQPGDSYHVPNIPGVTLSVSDGSAVSITLDDKRLGVVSRSGSAAEGVSLDGDALKAHFSH